MCVKCKLSDFVEAIRFNWGDDWMISPGLSPSCPECQNDYSMSPREFYAKYEAGKVADEGSFSWSSCDSCGSHLGGMRYAAHAARRGDDGKFEIQHISICVDCLMYHANGDEPENWEG